MCQVCRVPGLIDVLSYHTLQADGKPQRTVHDSQCPPSSVLLCHLSAMWTAFEDKAENKTATNGMLSNCIHFTYQTIIKERPTLPNLETVVIS